MIKRYESSSIVSISLGNGKMIEFEPKCGHGSYYITSKPEEQKILESHRWFNNRYILLSADDENESKLQEEIPFGFDNMTEVKFDTLADAKAYLVEAGANKSAIRSKGDAINVGSSMGYKIIFE